MGLDDIVRGITASGNDTEAGAENANETPETPKKTGKPRRGGKKAFEENLARYTRINEQGIAIWLPKEVKKNWSLSVSMRAVTFRCGLWQLPLS